MTFKTREEYVDLCRNEWRTLSFWRDCLAEFWSTFMLVSVQCALPLYWSEANAGGALQTALGMGFVVLVQPWILGEFGGVHMNPAVSFTLALGLKVTAVKCLIYWVVQCVSGIAAAGFVKAVTPANFTGTLAATQLGPGVDPWQGILIEAWITMNLCMAVFGATNTLRKPDLNMFSIVIGLSVAMGILCAFSSTGGSMNPARSLGPAVVMNIWDNFYVYWVGPLLGAALAALLYQGLLNPVSLPNPQYQDPVVDKNDLKDIDDQPVDGGYHQMS